ncbi:transcription initiation factor TFIID subunit 7-like [Acomys russatus]|uniref:transcription initiation factor TFIID subunit 7-like n=1 Tax=Acomys russatus TaxID=60746 RepID=UPI0021E20AAF|nr:transcription initiation factor TFIID subunit 7-like [Acomys russatus]
MERAEEGARAEGAPAEGAPLEVGHPKIPKAPSTPVSPSEEVSVGLGAESVPDPSDSGGAGGPDIPVASQAQPQEDHESTSPRGRGRARGRGRSQGRGRGRGRGRGKTIEKSTQEQAMSLKHDESYEIEEQFILRLPPEHAYAVRKIIHSRGSAMKDKLKIDFSPDGHHAVVQVEDVSLPAKLVNLPCVIGSLKTVDRKTFYKTADISQMLVCSAEGEPQTSPEKPSTSTDPTVTGNDEEKTDKKIYNWKHGITPPLKNVRKKRFRKTTKKLPDTKQMDEINFSEYTGSPNVEKELKRLLCSDAEAVSVRWEVVTDDETKETESEGCISSTSGTTQMSGPGSSEFDMLREIFDDSGSNSNDVEDKSDKTEDEDDDNQEETDEDDDKDDEEEEEEEKKQETDHCEEELERDLQAKFFQFSLYETSKDYTSIIMGIKKLIQYKERKLQYIYKKAQRQKDLLNNVENLTLKIHHLQEQLKCFLKE